MRFRTLFILIFCNLIWSAHPLMGKYLLLGFSAPQGAWLRYTAALFAYAIAFYGSKAATVKGPEAQDPGAGFFLPKSFGELGLVTALGFSAFCLSPLLQMSGLAASRAMDNSLIVAMEPLMTVLLAWLLLGERPTVLHFLAFGVALLGFGLLTEIGPATFQGFDPHLLGNLLLLYSLVGESLYSSLGRKLIVHYSPNAVFGSALFLGVFCLTFAVGGYYGTIPTVPQVFSMPWQSWVGLIWLGPVGTALCYLLWMHSLKDAPVATLALTLFIQPVLGPLLGVIFLGERLSAIQGFGCTLILLAVFSQAWIELRKIKAQSIQ